MPAELKEHRYTNGKRFVIVQCDDCGVAFNSAHHYTEAHIHHAQALADLHNRAVHAPDEPAAELERVCVDCGATGLLWRTSNSDGDGPWRCSRHAFGHIESDRYERIRATTEGADMRWRDQIERDLRDACSSNNPSTVACRLMGSLLSYFRGDTYHELNKLTDECIDSWYNAPKAG